MSAVLLYHGSDSPITKPRAGVNTGFADLGRGFYLTDDFAAAEKRAASRARKLGQARGIVSVFEFDEACVPWVCVGGCLPTSRCSTLDERFGLRFGTSAQGLASWMRYIKACRAGCTAVEGIGSPAVVRAWIATEEVEMVCSGFVEADELAAVVEPGDLVVQYCLLDQELIDDCLAFVEAKDTDLRH